MKVDVQPRDRKLAIFHALSTRGIRNPYLTVWAAREEGLPLSIACALLEKESGCGRNVFGHDHDRDGCIPPCGGNVTKARYLAYRERRRRDGRCQGVGPCQLTYWAFQDRADRLGGCWVPAVNLRVGFDLLAGYLNGRADRIVEAGTAYNGAHAYGVALAAVALKWRARFAADRKAGSP